MSINIEVLIIRKKIYQSLNLKSNDYMIEVSKLLAENTLEMEGKSVIKLLLNEKQIRETHDIQHFAQ